MKNAKKRGGISKQKAKIPNYHNNLEWKRQAPRNDNHQQMLDARLGQTTAGSARLGEASRSQTGIIIDKKAHLLYKTCPKRGQKSEDRRQKSEYRRKKTDNKSSDVCSLTTVVLPLIS